MENMQFKLNIFTLNCWDIPGISKDRKERMNAIGQYLAESSHNIVCLQEVWSEGDYLKFKDTLKEKLPYSHYFYSGVLGSGLCVFSKWMIQDVFFHQWALNGYIHKIQHGDWFGGKGVGLCRIRCGERLINVYCTHLHAVYDLLDCYKAHRMIQAHSTAELVYLTAEPADVSILAGDLNAVPSNISYKLITELPSLRDPFDMVCEGSNPGVRKASGTSDNPNNSYSSKNCNSPTGERIDHILFHTSPAWEPTVISFGNPLEDRVPGKSFSYSDHNAVALELRLKQTAGKHQQRPIRHLSKADKLDEAITDALQICQEALPCLHRSKILYIISGILVIIMIIALVEFYADCFVYYNMTFLMYIVNLFLTGLSLYYFIMGTLWNRIEVNSIKAGIHAFENFSQIRKQLKNEEALRNDDRC